MSWKNEIYRAIFVSFGMFELVTNIKYMVKKENLALARKQHSELPLNVSEKQIFSKVALMLTFGTLFFIVGLYFYFTKSFSYVLASTVLVLFAVYAGIEALYYRYWKTTGFFTIATTLFFIFVFT